MSDRISVNEVTINGIVYIPKSTVQQYSVGDIKIVVLQRGWVYIGRFSREGNICRLMNSFCIRRWGTTQGLPQLVHGPTADTILDKCDGVVEFDWMTVIHTISVDVSKWPNI